MAIKQLYGDRDLNGDVLKNHTFTVFADLAAANLVVGSVFGFAYMVDVGSLYYNQTGLSWQPIGAKGSKGDAGIPGNSVLSGSGAPLDDPAGTGVDGDFYIDTSSLEIYGPKTAGVWGSPTSLVGSPGMNGVDGNTVLNGVVAPTTEGVDGDFYLLTTTMDMYGPKTAGLWGAGTSLVGPQGIQGDPGVAGPVGPVGPPGANAPTASYVVTGSVDPATLTTVAAGPPAAVPSSPVVYYVDSTADLYYMWTVLAWSASVIEPFSYRYNGSYLYYTNDGGTATVAPTHTSGTVTGIDGVDWTVVTSSAGWAPLTSPLYLHELTYSLYHMTVAGWAVTMDLAAGTNLVSTPTAGPVALARYRNQTVLYDAALGAFSVTLPVSPLEGDVVRFKEKVGSTNVLTITGTVDGTVNPTCNLAYQLYVVEYLGGAWRKTN